MKLIDSSLPRFLLVGVGNTLLSAVLMFALEGLQHAPRGNFKRKAGY